MRNRTFIVNTGFDTPDERYEPGDEVTAADLPEKSVHWLEADGVIEEVASEPIDATDSALKLAAEKDLDLADVEGTGKDGRITKDDVEKALEALGED